MTNLGKRVAEVLAEWEGEDPAGVADVRALIAELRREAATARVNARESQ